MPQIINSNIMSLTAQRNLNKSQEAQQTAMERISSGLRINSAKDDAAGLAISTRFSSQTRGMSVAIRNAGDGISLAQTAEGKLSSMTESLQRVRELALQASNGTNSDSDRQALNAEAQELIASITADAEGANFNGRKLLDGSFKSAFQVGANAGETIDVSVAKLTADALGAAGKAGISATGTDNSLGNGDLMINGVAIAPSKASDDTASYSGASASAIAKVATINSVSDQTGVTAIVNENQVNGVTMTSAAAGGATLTLNGVDIALSNTTNSSDAEKAATRQGVAEAINAVADLTGVRAVDSGTNENGVMLVAEDGRNITMTAVASQFGLATAATTYEGGFTLVAEGGTDSIVISGGNGTGNGDLANAGLVAGSYDPSLAVVNSEKFSVTGGTAGDASQEALSAGDVVINGVTIGASSASDDTASHTVANTSNGAASGIAIAAAINKASDSTGVTATANETVVVGATAAAAAATAGVQIGIMINGVDIGTVTSQADVEKDRQATIDAINAKSGQTGVVAEDNGVSITMRAEDGRNITAVVGATATTASASFGLDATVNGIGLTTTAVAVDANSFASGAETTYSTVSLKSAGDIVISAGTGGTAGLTDSGFEAGKFGGGVSGQFLDEVDISTLDGAAKALTAIDNALSTITSERANLGAMQNRFESTISSLEVTSENLSAANSRIRDADFAKETAELSRTQVLQQAGISILAQANAGSQQVLSLLQ